MTSNLQRLLEKRKYPSQDDIAEFCGTDNMRKCFSHLTGIDVIEYSEIYIYFYGWIPVVSLLSQASAFQMSYACRQYSVDVTDYDEHSFGNKRQIYATNVYLKNSTATVNPTSYDGVIDAVDSQVIIKTPIRTLKAVNSDVTVNSVKTIINKNSTIRGQWLGICENITNLKNFKQIGVLKLERTHIYREPVVGFIEYFRLAVKLTQTVLLPGVFKMLKIDCRNFSHVDLKATLSSIGHACDLLLDNVRRQDLRKILPDSWWGRKKRRGRYTITSYCSQYENLIIDINEEMPIDYEDKLKETGLMHPPPFCNDESLISKLSLGSNRYPSSAEFFRYYGDNPSIAKDVMRIIAEYGSSR